MTDEAKYDDGNFYTVSLGHFIGLLVDAGQDPAVCFRVIGDETPDKDGKFIRRMELFLLPNGYVTEFAKSSKGVHKILATLIESGLVK